MIDPNETKQEESSARDEGARSASEVPPSSGEPPPGEAPTGEEAPGEPFFPIPESELLELRKKAEERDVLWNELLRAKADLDNYQKRVRRDRPVWEEQAQSRVFQRLLPVLDDFERALGALDHENVTVEALASGVRLALAALRKALDENGIEEIPAQGLPFDPEVHEAVEAVESDRPAGEIVAVLQKGYRRKGGAVLRPAKVRVAKSAEIPDSTGTASEPPRDGSPPRGGLGFSGQTTEG